MRFPSLRPSPSLNRPRRPRVTICGRGLLLLSLVLWCLWLDDDYQSGSVIYIYPNKGPCFPVGGTFGGVSTTSVYAYYAFETCWQFDQLETYCWTKAYLSWDGTFYQCIPNGGGKSWYTIDAKYVNPVTQPNSCGKPCHNQHHSFNLINYLFLCV